LVLGAILGTLGAILGTPVGESYGTNREILSDLRPALAKDGVHLEQMGNVNLSKAIISAVEQLRTGKLRDETGRGSGSEIANASGFSGASKSKGFFGEALLPRLVTVWGG
jgi:hypothetical protein